MKPLLLIADADGDLLDLHQRFFIDHGCRVATATNGLGCLAQLRRHVPDVLILDRDLPWGGAAGVLDLMREAADVPLVPVVLMSTSPADGDMLSHPVIVRLPKPFRLQALVKAVTTAVATIPERAASRFFLD